MRASVETEWPSGSYSQHSRTFADFDREFLCNEIERKGEKDD